MTPEILTLSRTVCSMPDAPKPVVPMRANVDATGRCFRDEATGIMWRDPRVVGSEWVLDLTDPATGGALLSYIGPGWIIYQRHHDGAWEISRTNGADRQEGETLGIAVAKVIAVRGWKP